MKSRFAFSPKRKAPPSKYRSKVKGLTFKDSSSEDPSRLPAKRRKTVAAKLFKQALRVRDDEAIPRELDGFSSRSIPNRRSPRKKTNSQPSGLFALEQLPFKKPRTRRESEKAISHKTTKITPAKKTRGARPAMKRMVWIQDSIRKSEPPSEPLHQDPESFMNEDIEMSFNQIETPSGDAVALELDDISSYQLLNSYETSVSPSDLPQETRFVEVVADNQQSQESCKSSLVVQSGAADSVKTLHTLTVKERIPRGYGILRRNGPTKIPKAANSRKRCPPVYALVDEDDILSLDDISISDNGAGSQEICTPNENVPHVTNFRRAEPEIRSKRKKPITIRRDTKSAPLRSHNAQESSSISPTGLFSRGPIQNRTSKERNVKTLDPSEKDKLRRALSVRLISESSCEPQPDNSLFAHSPAGLFSRGKTSSLNSKGRRAIKSSFQSGGRSMETSPNARKSAKVDKSLEVAPAGLFSRNATKSLNSRGRNTRRAKGSDKQITTKGSTLNLSNTNCSLTTPRRNRAKANIYLPRQQKKNKLKGTEWGAGVLYEAMTCFETRGVILLMEKELQHFTITYSPGHTLLFPPMNSYYRILLHKLCDRFLLKSGSDGLWEERAIRVEYTEQAQIPLLSLCDWIVKPKQVLCERSLDHVSRGGLRCPTDKFDSLQHDDFLPVSKGVACRYKWRHILPTENLVKSQDLELSAVGLDHIAEFVFENAPNSMSETQALVDEICSSSIDKACEMIIVNENTCLVLVPSHMLLPQLISYERPGISIRDLANATEYTKRRAGFPTFKRKKTDLSIFNRVVNRSLGIRKQQQQQNRKEECKYG